MAKKEVKITPGEVSINYDLKPWRLFIANMILCFIFLLIVVYGLFNTHYNHKITAVGSWEKENVRKGSNSRLINAQFSSNESISNTDIRNLTVNLTGNGATQVVNLSGGLINDLTYLGQDKYRIIIKASNEGVPKNIWDESLYHSVSITFDAKQEMLYKQLFKF